jgi:DNA-binding XRE family transcriptional regulator
MRIDSATDFGRLVRTLRRAQALTQEELALTAGTNRRFIIELERGKATCQLAKALHVLRTLGGTIDVPTPGAAGDHPAGG